MPKGVRNTFIAILVIVAVFGAITYLGQKNAETAQEIKISELVGKIQRGEVQRTFVEGSKATVTLADGAKYVVQLGPSSDSLEERLARLGVTQEQLREIGIEYAPPSEGGGLLGTLVGFLPFLLFGVLIFYMMRRASQDGGAGGALQFGKSRARMFTSDRPTVTFNDVAGADEAKEELREVVEFLKRPEKFIALGARIPKGVLMVGPPGCGKTLMARAVAGEAEVPFFSISGSEFVEMFVGVGASRVRDLFEQAKKHSPCIVFVDEIDAVGRHRGAGLGGSHDEREQTLNQILVEMDGFDTDTNVIVMAATNRPDILDPALLRPGRFDRQVILDRPDIKGRRAILDIHVRGKPLSDDVNLDVIAKQTPGFTGADLENVVNEGAILAARNNRKSITMPDLQNAMEKVVAGPERKSRVISPAERSITAKHEAGHTLVGWLLPYCDPVPKVSIISRGRALGYTVTAPEEDRYLTGRKKFEDDLAMMLGGRAAEELFCGDITTGASSDLEKATKLARRMVTEFGMSEELGPLTFGQKQELVFLGREIGEQRDYSEKIAEAIDGEVRRLIKNAYERAKSILREHAGEHAQVVKQLLELETLIDADLAVILGEKVKVEVEISSPSGN